MSPLFLKILMSLYLMQKKSPSPYSDSQGPTRLVHSGSMLTSLNATSPLGLSPLQPRSGTVDILLAQDLSSCSPSAQNIRFPHLLAHFFQIFAQTSPSKWSLPWPLRYNLHNHMKVLFFCTRPLQDMIYKACLSWYISPSPFFLQGLFRGNQIEVKD